MRTLAILLAALTIGFAMPSAAAPPPHASGGANGADNGGGGGGAPPAASPAAQEQAKKDGVPPDRAKKAGHGPPDQDAAHSAVLRLEALPLAKIIKIAERRMAGRVINARLLRVSGVLLYQLTRLDEVGRSWRDYYNAATGNPVVLR
jgi:hypothetical protein